MAASDPPIIGANPPAGTDAPFPAGGSPAGEPPIRRSIGPAELFVAFSRLALSGFGGVLPFAYRALVERRQWLDAREFAGLLAIAQVMPGPTICNLSVMIGQRHAGFAGSCAALAGMVLGPFCIVIALGVGWQHYGEIPEVKRALGGMSAVAIGLLLATAVKMAINLFDPERSGPAAPASFGPWPRALQMGLCALGFAGVGLMRWPLAAVVAGLAPAAIALSWVCDRPKAGA